MSKCSIAHLIDVGSTWTKGIAVSLQDGRLIARCQYLTTLTAGIMQGVNAVIRQLEAANDTTPTFRAATSSAAGGLRVAAVGLVPGLTGLAAKQASLGAGARVVYTGAYTLGPDEIEAMRRQSPDIILLAGGTDGGNTDVILKNAARLANAKIPAAVVLAGNKSARSEALAVLRNGGCEVRVADNVLPDIDTVRVESAQEAIRTEFLERIVVARGIDELREWALGVVMPTPKAVLDATAFLADVECDQFGILVVVDIGGATTDVHSVGGSEPKAGTLLKGLPEPRIKRTVEGDLGLRVSAAAATDALGPEPLAQRLGITVDDLRRVASERVAHPGTVAEQDSFDRVYAVAAVCEALTRHAGRLDKLPLMGETWGQIGKDLRDAKVVVGSGGVFAARPDARELLHEAVQAASRGERLVPRDPRLLIDTDYVLFAVGLLSRRYPEAATSLALRSLGLFD